jgi:hypothetical protein
MYENTRCVDLAAGLGAVWTGFHIIVPPRLTLGELRQSALGTSAFQLAEIKVPLVSWISIADLNYWSEVANEK